MSLSLSDPARAITARTADADQRAEELVLALVALPEGHPDRPATRRRAIEAWLPMAERLARRYAGRGEPLDDLLQIARSA